MDYMALSAAEWQQEYDKVTAEYERTGLSPVGRPFTSILSGDLFPRRLEKWSLPRRN